MTFNSRLYHHMNKWQTRLHLEQPKQLLAANLRRAFSGIVAGNVKEEGVKAIKQHGPYILSGEPSLMKAMDKLLQAYVDEGRMKLPGSKYCPLLHNQGVSSVLKPHLLLIDALNLIRRIYAVDANQKHHSDEQMLKASCARVAHACSKLLSSTKATHAIAVFDGDKSWRYHFYKDYKRLAVLLCHKYLKMH